MKTYTLHIDAAHAWLEVPKQELEIYGVAGNISTYSYEKDGTAYLEEDCDMATFCRALNFCADKFSFKEIYHGNTAPIRYMEKYNAN